PTCQAAPNFYNAWRGFGVEPNPHGSCDLYLAHLRDNIANGDLDHYHWVLGWMANAIQHPEIAAQVALVYRGEKGAGKGEAVQPFLKLLGSHALHVTSPGMLTAHFNAQLKHKVAIFADEIFWAGDHSADSRLKTLITEPTILIEAKYCDPIVVQNVAHVLISANAGWVVPATQFERRYAVFNVGTDQRG